MKMLLALMMLMTASHVFGEEIHHTIVPGNLHTGGELTIRIINERQTDFDAQITYKIKPRAFVPVPSEYRQGTFTATLPIEYLDERGYEALAESGPTIQQGAKLEYLGLEDVDGYRETRHVRLSPQEGKWNLEAWYHPSVAATGWVKLGLELQVPLIGRYKVFSVLTK